MVSVLKGNEMGKQPYWEFDLVTIPAPRDQPDQAGFELGQIPVNDTTRPCDGLIEKIRSGLDLHQAKLGRIAT